MLAAGLALLVERALELVLGDEVGLNEKLAKLEGHIWSVRSRTQLNEL